MNVITSNPIIDENDFRAEDFENFFGEKARRRRAMRQSRRRTKRGQRGKDGTFLERVKGGIDKVRDSGILDSIQGVTQGRGGYDAPIDDSFIPVETPQQRGMSNAAKIAIGVGVAAILGIGIYVATRKK